MDSTRAGFAVDHPDAAVQRLGPLHLMNNGCMSRTNARRGNYQRRIHRLPQTHKGVASPDAVQGSRSMGWSWTVPWQTLALSPVTQVAWPGVPCSG